MNRIEAGTKLRSAMASMTVAQAETVRLLMEEGAGLLGLPDGSVMSGPADIPEAMRDVYANLIDAVYNCEPESGEQEWEPCYGGMWEDVIATLLIENDWPKLEECAKDLRELVQS